MSALLPALSHPPLLQASPLGGLTQGCNDPSFLVMMASVAAVFYFILWRPQQKQASQQKQMLASLKKGDNVVTQSGMFGRVVQVGEKDLVLEVAVGGGSTRVRWLKSQVAGLEPSPKAEGDGAGEEKKA